MISPKEKAFYLVFKMFFISENLPLNESNKKSHHYALKKCKKYSKVAVEEIIKNIQRIWI